MSRFKYMAMGGVWQPMEPRVMTEARARELYTFLKGEGTRKVALADCVGLLAPGTGEPDEKDFQLFLDLNRGRIQISEVVA